MRAGCMWVVSRPPATSRTSPPSSPMPWLLLGAPLQALVSALIPFPICHADRVCAHKSAKQCTLCLAEAWRSPLVMVLLCWTA